MALTREDSAMLPKFGRIDSLFEHIFCGKTNTWAKVQPFGSPNKDDDSGLWRCTYDDDLCSILVHLSKLSFPLAIAH